MEISCRKSVIYARPLIVLAGGFGTRLRSVVSSVPKPLAPVGGRPFIHYLLKQWVQAGIGEFIFLLHHQASLIQEYLHGEHQSGILRNCSIGNIVEDEPLGTGGAVAHAVKKQVLNGSFFVANADTWLGYGVEAVNDAGTPALAVVRVENTERYGSVDVDAGMVSAFREKEQSSGAGMINAGLYHLHAELFSAWQGNAFSLEQELFPRLAQEKRLKAVTINSDFIDIGVPEDYHRFCRWIESGRKGPL